MYRASRLASAFAAGAAVLLALPAAAFAHTQRQVGAYQLTVGWADEPAYVGEQNAVQLFVHGSDGQPVDDLGSPPTLNVTVIFGAKTSAPLDLQPSFDPDTGLGTHGEFDAAIIPTQPGNYTFHFYGTIAGQPVDERFTSGPTTFATVDTPSGIQFPDKTPSAAELATLSDRLSTRVASAQNQASASRGRADTGEILGAVGVTVGVIGLVVGGLALRRAGRPVSRP